MRVCAKNVGGAYARGGAYLRDTTVWLLPHHMLSAADMSPQTLVLCGLGMKLATHNFVDVCTKLSHSSNLPMYVDTNSKVDYLS